MESIAYGTRNVLETMARGNITIDTCVASGGVIKDPLWISIISDVCRTPITITKSSTYAGLMGSAIISAVSRGIYPSYEAAAAQMITEEYVVEPNLHHSAEYDQWFEKYLAESRMALQKLAN
jgi:L-ribulokinase